MTRILLFLIVSVLVLAPRPALAGDLTLRDVIELHRSGLGDQLLMAVIEADGGPFSLGFADIQDLKGEGISERVISTLVRTGSRPRASAEVPTVSVEQHVTNVVPALVVVGGPGPVRDGEADDRRHGRDGDDRAGRRDRRGSHGRDAPAATWVEPDWRESLLIRR